MVRDFGKTYSSGTGATGSNRARAAGAAGPVVLALLAHQAGPRPGSGNTSTCKAPPHPFKVQVESGGESGPVVCKGSRAARAQRPPLDFRRHRISKDKSADKFC